MNSKESGSQHVTATLWMLSSAALGPMVGVLTDGRDLAVRLGHELLKLLLEELVSGLGFRGWCGRGTGRTVLEIGRALSGTEIASGGIFPLGLCFQPLDGQIDLTAIGVDDHDLYILALGEMLTNVADKGIGNFGNMYHAGFIFRQ